MKKALLTLAVVATGASAFSQGTLLVSNLNISTSDGSGVYSPGIYRDNGDGLPAIGNVNGGSTVGAGAGYIGGIFLASNLTTPLATVLFRTTTRQEIFANNTQEIPVPGVPAGSTANLVFRAWDSTSASYDAALAAGQQVATFAFTSQPLGGPNPNPNLPAIFSPALTGLPTTGLEMHAVPEPGTIALGALGIGALLLRRRRK